MIRWRCSRDRISRLLDEGERTHQKADVVRVQISRRLKFRGGRVRSHPA